MGNPIFITKDLTHMLKQNSLLKPQLSNPLLRTFVLRKDDVRHIFTRQPVTNYTRDYLRQLAEDPNFEQTQIENKFLEKFKTKEIAAYTNVVNEKNPVNRVKVTFNTLPQQPPNLPYNNAKILDNPENQLKQPFILRVTPQWMEKGPIITARRKGIKGSVKKIKPQMKPIIGMHIIDAMDYMSKVRKRAAKSILATLGQARMHAIHRGFDENKLFVQSAMTLKDKRRKGLYYHAKGVAGRLRKDWSQFVIHLEEKPAKKFFKMMIGGRCPAGLAAIYKKNLIESDANYEDVRKLQFLLTPQGRHRRRIMIRRRAYIRKQEFDAKGVFVTMRTMEAKILEEDAVSFQEEYETFRNRKDELGLSERKKIFERNEAVGS